MLQPQNITEYFINTRINPGDTVIDATAGNGFDTLKLCRAVSNSGTVFAFDIQECALNETKRKLYENNFQNAELIRDCHSKIDKYINKPVSAVIFNLGYLPGGDHTLQTKHNTTISAIEKSLDLLTDNGFISVTVYYGKNSGCEEKDMVMKYLKHLDHKSFTVLTCDFHNRPNNPPITVIITKNQK